MKVIWGLAALLCAVVAFVWIQTPVSALSRVNILVGSDPVSVWSWDKEDGSFDVIVLQGGLSSDNATYGRYSLEALWKLGFIDKKAGSVLARSLEDALALPIPWYIGRRDTLLPAVDSEQYGRKIFSFSGTIPFLLTRRLTNLSLGIYLRYAWALLRAKPGEVHVYVAPIQAVTAEESLPDGSTRQFLDTQKIDVVLKGRFEDEDIRTEGMTVGIYNTTATASLGTYAARLLSMAGALVVVVGNREPEVDRCVLEGSTVSLKSKTAAVIVELFDCFSVAKDSDGSQDLVVRLGMAYAERFRLGH